MISCKGDRNTVLKNAVFDTYEQILALSEQSPEKRGMATTLIACVVDDSLHCIVVNVGDSRAHIITRDHVKVSKDHSVVNELIDSGDIAPEDAWQHPLSNVMTQAVGDSESVIKPDFYTVNLRNTFILLSSYGLHDDVSRATYIRIMGAGVLLTKKRND